VSELAGQVVAPAQDLALKTHANAQPIRNRDEHEVAGRTFATTMHGP
jgi:hypothetical protein